MVSRDGKIGWRAVEQPTGGGGRARGWPPEAVGKTAIRGCQGGCAIGLVGDGLRLRFWGGGWGFVRQKTGPNAGRCAHQICLTAQGSSACLVRVSEASAY